MVKRGAKLELQAVTFGYGGQPVLAGLDLSVEAGEMAALLGPNGAGKSTLLNLAAGVLQPGSGMVRLDGVDLRGIPARERAQRVAMVAQGLARVYSFPDNRACLDMLFAAEGRARLAGLGIWADPYYSTRSANAPGDLLARAGQYELVEGRVLLAEQSGGRVYLNFGRFWKEDFTAVIEAPALRLFAEAGIDPLVLENALVRIRGWVDDRDGPRIEVTHPEQIEVLATR